MLGEAGQERLKAARVLIAGAGGLGTVIATYFRLPPGSGPSESPTATSWRRPI